MAHNRRVRLTLGVSLLAATLLSGCSAIPLPLPNVPLGGPIVAPGGTHQALPVPGHVYSGLTSPDRTKVTPVPDAQPPGFTTPPEGSGYDRYYNQTITWGSCTSGKKAQCAHVLAPLDWYNPDGQAITLTMKRRAATADPADPASPDLFINPGGPGGSAQGYVDGFNTSGLEGYNIIGLDPRGSGESTPVVCGTTAQIDAYFELDGSPDDDAEKQALIDGTRDFTRQCLQNSGALLEHISTIEAVYDFDMVRQLLGDQKFNWLGVSYGTYIGAVYAELYPANVGRMVLDAAVNITNGDAGAGGVSQADGFELALNKFAEWLVSSGKYTSVDDFMTRLTNFIQDLDSNPIKVGNRNLTQTLFVNGLALYMYLGTDGYDPLNVALKVTMDNRDGSLMLDASDAMNDRNSSGYGSLATAFPAIACKDSADPGVDISYNAWEKGAQDSKIFEKYMGPNIVCPVWAAEPAAQIDFRGAGDPPFLVLGGTGDNATPYQYAKAMAKQMPSAILVTRDGVGHGSYDSGSSCIDKIVRSFLTAGTLPGNGVTCPMD